MFTFIIKTQSSNLTFMSIKNPPFNSCPKIIYDYLIVGTSQGNLLSTLMERDTLKHFAYSMKGISCCTMTYFPQIRIIGIKRSDKLLIKIRTNFSIISIKNGRCLIEFYYELFIQFRIRSMIEHGYNICNSKLSMSFRINA